MKKKIVEKSIIEFQKIKQLRKDKRYLITDETPIESIAEFRSFQRFLEKMVILSRHNRIKIYGGLMIIKNEKE